VDGPFCNLIRGDRRGEGPIRVYFSLAPGIFFFTPWGVFFVFFGVALAGNPAGKYGPHFPGMGLGSNLYFPGTGENNHGGG